MADSAVTSIWRPELGFGERLRLVRIQYGQRIGHRLSQREMATRLGVSEASYAQWEAGNTRPGDIVATAKRVYALTAVDPIWLLNLDNTDWPPEDPSGAGSICTAPLIHLRRSLAIPTLKLWRPGADKAA